MRDIINRLLIAASLLTGTIYLPTLSQAVSAGGAGAEASAASVRTCPARPPAAGARALACIG